MSEINGFLETQESIPETDIEILRILDSIEDPPQEKLRDDEIKGQYSTHIKPSYFDLPEETNLILLFGNISKLESCLKLILDRLEDREGLKMDHNPQLSYETNVLMKFFTHFSYRHPRYNFRASIRELIDHSVFAYNLSSGTNESTNYYALWKTFYTILGRPINYKEIYQALPAEIKHNNVIYYPRSSFLAHDYEAFQLFVSDLSISLNLKQIIDYICADDDNHTYPLLSDYIDSYLKYRSETYEILMPFIYDKPHIFSFNLVSKMIPKYNPIIDDYLQTHTESTMRILYDIWSPFRGQSSSPRIDFLFQSKIIINYLREAMIQNYCKRYHWDGEHFQYYLGLLKYCIVHNLYPEFLKLKVLGEDIIEEIKIRLLRTLPEASPDNLKQLIYQAQLKKNLTQDLILTPIEMYSQMSFKGDLRPLHYANFYQNADFFEELCLYDDLSHFENSKILTGLAALNIYHDDTQVSYHKLEDQRFLSFSHHACNRIRKLGVKGPTLFLSYVFQTQGLIMDSGTHYQIHIPDEVKQIKLIMIENNYCLSKTNNVLPSFEDLNIYHFLDPFKIIHFDDIPQTQILINFTNYGLSVNWKDSQDIVTNSYSSYKIKSSDPNYAKYKPIVISETGSLVSEIDQFKDLFREVGIFKGLRVLNYDGQYVLYDSSQSCVYLSKINQPLIPFVVDSVRYENQSLVYEGKCQWSNQKIHYMDPCFSELSFNLQYNLNSKILQEHLKSNM